MTQDVFSEILSIFGLHSLFFHWFAFPYLNGTPTPRRTVSSLKKTEKARRMGKKTNRIRDLGNIFSFSEVLCQPSLSWSASPQLFLFYFIFYWSIVNLQCCVSFKCTARWFIYTYIHAFFFRFFSIIGYYKILRASLVAQWLRICLPMQGTRVWALIWEDPTCRGAAGPVSHNYWACASAACAPQQERLR